MPEQITDPWLIGAICALAFASVATWVWLLARRNGVGYILPYEPRRPVPWNAFATLLAILFVALSVASVFEPPGPISTEGQAEPSLMPIELAGRIAVQTFFVGGFFAVIVAAFQATPTDLGLPRNARRAACDVGVGAVAWLASIVPVHGLNVILTLLFSSGPEEEHPLIDMMLENPQPLIMILGTLLAVVIAPLSEEITFRLLLQGWLEKWEDGVLGWRKVATAALPAPSQRNADAQFIASDQALPVGALPIGDDSILPTLPEDIAAQANELLATSQAPLSLDPPSRGLLGLPHGWLPILVSSVLFAAPHVGFGATALLPLAAILGYIYQRTHRILPCMVAHALFNLTSTMFLWRIVSLQAE